MKNLSIVLNVVLFVAVIVLYVLYFSGHKSPETAMTSKVAGTADATKIVYINTDTLLNNYQLAVELNEAFLKKQEDRRTELNIKAKQSIRKEPNSNGNCKITVLFPKPGR